MFAEGRLSMDDFTKKDMEEALRAMASMIGRTEKAKRRVEYMKKYIVLLRGINVGGKNKISMKELKELLEEYGFLDVVTYINSGNIVFSSHNSDIEFLKRNCEALIFEKFKLELLLMVITAEELIFCSQ